MDILNPLISTFTPKNTTEFRNQLSNSPSDNFLELLDLIQANPKASAEELCTKFSKPITLRAFYSQRTRLSAKVVVFLFTKEIEEDTSRWCQVLGYLILFKRLMRYQKFEAAGEMLKHAEKGADENNHFSLLELVLALKVKYFEKLKINYKVAREKLKRNTGLLMSFRKLELTYSDLRNQLAEAIQNGNPLDAEATIDNTLGDYQSSEIEANTPEFMFRLCTIARNAYISVKNYKKIEPFISKIYNRLDKACRFELSTVHCQAEFLMLLAHTEYRNRKFSQVGERLNKIELITDKHPFVMDEHWSKFVALQAGVASYTGENKEAIKIIEKALKDDRVFADESERCNMMLNLAVYYFNDRRFKDANAQLRRLDLESAAMQNKGREWKMKKEMIEIIVQFELGNDDIAGNQIKRFAEEQCRHVKVALVPVDQPFSEIYKENDRKSQHCEASGISKGN
jgi:tetratricopeptide (TPR) repeat protein